MGDRADSSQVKKITSYWRRHNCGSAYFAELLEEFNMVFHLWED